MRLMTRDTINQYAKDNPKYKNPLYSWANIVEVSSWSCFADLKKTISYSPDLISTKPNVLKSGDSRIVFDIGNNDMRLITHVNFRFKIVYVKDFLTHKEYDNIDLTTKVYD